MDDPSFYVFPVYGEAGAVKAAQDCGGRPTTARDRTFEVDDDELARVSDCMQHLFGAAVGAPRRTKTCLYTLTPDRDFVLDAVPGAPEVLVALGAAHGFKFASWFGRTLAELAQTGTTAHDLAPFRFDRAALTDRAYAPNWMV
jgi:sarcosine oxidase